eukprot:TRINITY_DN1485_c0_g1_i1.p1 TRINITY_DN1485_c0_g1~~TRINITY_DN1485_c0_g1_i1.p1  ORF type:complete len:237 (+),score=74.40 TRINITY_DN1485_c0_g1_i1:248-958(+)
MNSISLSMIVLWAVLLFINVDGVSSSRSIMFINKCKQEIFLASDSTISELPVLSSGQSSNIFLSDSFKGLFWGRTGCHFDSFGYGFCETGDCGGKKNCFKSSASSSLGASVVDLSLSESFTTLDYYDISLVNGFNLGVSVEPSKTSSDSMNNFKCGRSTCSPSFGQFPQELARKINGETKGFASPCEDGKECKESKYTQLYKRICPNSRTFSFDDINSTFACKSADYTITFCPTEE